MPQIRSPSAMASLSRFSTTMPQPLTAHEAVGRSVKRLALPVRRQHPRVRPELRQPSEEDRLHPADDHQVRLVPLQAVHRLVQRKQRRRARCVHRHSRPLQPQRVRHAPRGRVERRPRDGVQARGRLGGLVCVKADGSVVVVADAHVHARAAALQPVRVHQRVLKRLPARLQHHALLRVKQLRLDGGDAEELGVEQVDVVDQRSKPARGVVPRRFGVELADAPDARARHALRDRVPARLQQPPERRQVRRPRKLARHPDDGYRLVRSARFRLSRPRGGFSMLVSQGHTPHHNRDPDGSI